MSSQGTFPWFNDYFCTVFQHSSRFKFNVSSSEFFGVEEYLRFDIFHTVSLADLREGFMTEVSLDELLKLMHCRDVVAD